MTTTDTPPLRISSPVDLIRATPYLLGFHPTESLVLIGVDDTAVVVSARVDLDHLDYRGDVLDVFRAIRRSSANGVVAIIYTETNLCGTLAEVPLSEPANNAGIELIDTMRVSGGRWRSLNCANTTCCPVNGKPLPNMPTAIEASAIFAGLTALPNRAAIAAQFAPIPNRPNLMAEAERYWALRETIELKHGAATWERSSIRALYLASRRASDGVWPTDDQVARFGVALFAIPVRDALWLAVDSGHLPGNELWINLARRLPRSLSAGPLFLAGWRAFRDGDGAMAGVAAESALTADPMCTAADLLLTALGHGVDPRTLPHLRLSKGGDITG